MTTQHTPEPWDLAHWSKKSSTGWRLVSNTLEDHIDLEAKDNLERIIQCVNACAGIANPEAIPDIVAALKFYVGFFEENALNIEWDHNHQAFKKALAKLEGYVLDK